MNIPNFNTIKIKDYIPKKSLLSNNIPIYCFENNDMDVVFVKIVFQNAGTIFQNKYFVASLTRTQLAQDTKDYSALSLADAMDYYGVNFTHSTSNERTILNFSFLKQYEKEVLKLIEQIVLYPVFSKDKLEITINNSKQEFLLKCQQTSFLAHREFMSALFGKDHPYGRYASLDDYDKVAAVDLKEFYAQRYTYNQCFIIAAGNLSDGFLDNTDAVLGKTNWNEQTAITEGNDTVINPYVAKTVITSLDTAVQSSICMGKLMPDIRHEDYVPLSVMNCIFGGYFNSRLMSNIREEKGLTYGIDSFIAPFDKGSVMMIVSDVAAGKDEQTIDEIYKEADRLCNEPVSQEELTTVKNYMLGEMLRSNDGVSDISDTYDNFIRFNLPSDYNSSSMERVKNTTAEEIRQLAEKYLNKDSFVVSICKNIQ